MVTMTYMLSHIVNKMITIFSMQWLTNILAEREGRETCEQVKALTETLPKSNLPLWVQRNTAVITVNFIKDQSSYEGEAKRNRWE